MRALLLAAFLLPCAALAAQTERIPVDWNHLETPLGEDQVAGLRRLGFRLEADGRVLDLELKALDAAGLQEALRLLAAGDRRGRLERLRVLLADQPQEQPLSAQIRAQALALADGDLAARIGEGTLSAAALNRLARVDLNLIAKVFDGGAARAGVAVVAPESPTPARPLLPYLTMSEQQAGESLRAAAVSHLSNYERGRTILARLNGKDGRPDLPPILIEASATPARYDAARHAVVIDREAAVTELLVGVLPVDRAARRRALSMPDALTRELAARPDVAARVIARNDVLVAHELTHAWQDRRDPLWRRMSRQQIPNALPFEYEEEANLEKNLYIHDVLRGNPGADIDARELADYQSMMRGYSTWRGELRENYADSADLSRIGDMVRQREEAVRVMPANTADERRQKALVLLRLRRSAGEIDSMRTAHEARVRDARSGPIAANSREMNSVLARHFLAVATGAPNSIERAVALNSARVYAEASGDASLVEQVQSQLGRRQ